MVLGPGLRDIFPKGVKLTEEQKHHIEARYGIERILINAAKKLGEPPPCFIMLPVFRKNGKNITGERKEVVFTTIPVHRATAFGLQPMIVGDDPWNVHAKIGVQVSAFLEKQGIFVCSKR